MSATKYARGLGKKAFVELLVSELDERGVTPLNVTKEDMAEFHLHVSYDNGKVKAPCIDLFGGCKGTCDPNVPCAHDCYAQNGPIAWPYRKKLVYLNWLLWCADPERYEREVIAAIINYRFARFHADGDIPDPRYLGMLRRVSAFCSDTTIWLMNKRGYWVDSDIDENGDFPLNLKVLMSNWGNWRQKNKHGLPEFWVILKNGAGRDKLPANAFPCPGDCDFCKKNHCGCPYAKKGDVIWINQHR